MNVNQQSQPIHKEPVCFRHLTLEEKNLAVDLLFRHMDLEIVRTNKTKYGNFELKVQPTT